MGKKTVFGLVVVLFISFAYSVKAQQLDITFTTTQISGAKYAPDHIIAIWIKDASGNYVKTLMVYANKRKTYLYKWNASSSGNVTDAITGATISSFKTYSLTWDLKDYTGKSVSPGTYKLCMEMTSENKQGPYREIDFTVGGANYSLTPADGQNFKGITVALSGSTTSVPSKFSVDKYLKVFPNPVTNRLNATIFLEQNSNTTVSVYTIRNELILKQSYELNKGVNNIIISDIDRRLASGSYLLVVESNHYILGTKFSVSR